MYRMFLPFFAIVWILFSCQCEESRLEEIAPNFECVNCPSDKIIDFGVVRVNTTKEVDLQIQNTGKNILEFKSVNVVFESGVNSEAFSIVQFTASIAPSQKGVIKLAYFPRRSGVDGGKLILEWYHNKAAGKVKTETYTLRGRGAEVGLDICTGDENGSILKCTSDCENNQKDACLSLDFGSIDPKTSDISKRSVIIKNIGEIPMMQKGITVKQCPPNNNQCVESQMISAYEFTLEPTNTKDITIGSKQSNITSVVYKPMDGGKDIGQIVVITDDELLDEVIISITAVGMAPKLCYEAPFYNFGVVPVNTRSDKIFNIKSCGTKPVKIKSISVKNNPDNEFGYDGTTSQIGEEMVPNEEVGLKLYYIPKNEGLDTGSIIIESDDPSLKEGKAEINLMGTGQNLPSCILKLDPVSLDYGHMAAGQKQLKDFYIYNLGDGACEVTKFEGPSNRDNFRIISMFIQGSSSGVISSIPFSMMPGDRVKVQMEYTAQAEKTCISDKMLIYSNSIDSPYETLYLTGCGGEEPVCKFFVLPENNKLNWGNVPVGKTYTRSVVLENIGTSDCYINTGAFGPNVGKWFKLVRVPTYPLRVPVGTSARFDIWCTPDRSGHAPDKDGNPDSSGTKNFISITTTDPNNSSLTFPMLCNGVSSYLMVTPEPAVFPNATSNCSGPDVTISMYNVGSAPLTVSNIVSNSSEFLISAKPNLPLIIQPGSKSSIKMKFSPQFIGSRESTLMISSDASNLLGGKYELLLIGKGLTDSKVEERFVASTKPKIDILWCIDNSGSMADDQASLAGNFPIFINYAVSLNADYQIGVISSEINEAAKTDSGDYNYPGVLFNKKGTPKIIANNPPQNPTPNYQPVLKTSMEIIEAFRKNALIGECCSDEAEACFEATKKALTSPIIDDPNKNKGFLRDQAKLYLIMVADEDDQSPGTVDYYVDYLKQIKKDATGKLLSLSIVAGLDKDGDINNLPTPMKCPGSSSESAGIRYLDMYKKIGKGIAASICNRNWGPLMSKLGLDVFDTQNEFFLHSRPAENSVEVYVAGKKLDKDTPSGFTYDSVNNSVILGPDVNISEGDEVKVTYNLACY
ncbi:MAG: choice-of-anchor D domain-containing protein [Deltaproteobacteria bacterium]|nr:choice-of-anchor D domain-containing protein [Deltaproteobacteria bacterium]